MTASSATRPNGLPITLAQRARDEQLQTVQLLEGKYKKYLHTPLPTQKITPNISLAAAGSKELQHDISFYQMTKQIVDYGNALIKTLTEAIEVCTKAIVPLNSARIQQFDVLGLHTLFNKQLETAKKDKEELEGFVQQIAESVRTHQITLSYFTKELGTICYEILSKKEQISWTAPVTSLITPYETYIDQFIVLRMKETTIASTPQHT